MKDQIAVSIFKRFQSIPERTGLAYKDNTSSQWQGITWGEVETRVREIACALLDHGIKHQDKVAIYAQNSLEWALTDLAIMSVGGITIPVYATNTSKQAEYIVNDASVELLFAGDTEQYEKSVEILDRGLTPLKTVVAFVDTPKAKGGPGPELSSFINIDPSPELLDEFDRRFKAVTPDDLATIIYTSGTTGEPKGVMLTHANFISTFKIHDNYLSFLEDTDHSLSFLPLSHVFERAWTLYCMHRGLKVSILTNTKEIIEALQHIKPTLFCTVPRIYEKIYNEIQNRLEHSSAIKQKLFNWALEQGRNYQKLRNENTGIPFLLKTKKQIADKLVLNKIKAVVGGHIKMTPTAGAPLSAEIQDFMIAAGVPITIGYGLTETTATVTAFPQTHYKIGSVGKPLEGIEIKIGAENEILVKAPTVMKGYYNKEKETSECFADGWFRTGDAGRIDEEGNLYITDRIKDLMKTAGGKYIVPQQTEALLTNDNFIEQVVLVAEGKPYVSALVVPNFEALKKQAALLSLDYTSVGDLLAHAEIKQFFEAKINQLQQGLAEFEKIRRVKLLPREFSMEKGELTPTLKVRRKIITVKFDESILELYQPGQGEFVV